MALNEKYRDADQFEVPVSAVVPASPESGDAVLVGDMPAVALTSMWKNADNVDTITVRTNGAHHLEVAASDGALDWGETVYIDSSTGALSNNSGGVRFGFALGAVDSGATSTIPVKING